MDRSKTFDWIPHDLRIAKKYAYDFNEKVLTFLKRRKHKVLNKMIQRAFFKSFYQEYPKNLFLDLFSLIFL